MRVKQFSEATGLPRSSIRFYERVGLLAPEAKDRATGYRAYGAAEVERARAIRLAQGLGFSLKETRALIDAWEKGALDPAGRRAAIVEKLGEVDEKLAALAMLRDYLAAVVAWMDAGETGPKPTLGRTGC